MLCVYLSVTLSRFVFASDTQSHVLDYAALVQQEKSVYYVCLGTDERASHVIRDDLTSGWSK